MSARRPSQAGFTLVEVLLAMTLMLIVFAATLAVFTTMERGSRSNQLLNEGQQQVRTATDALARRLRNLASPSDSSNPLDQQPLERAQPQDLVFRTVRGDGAPTADNPQNIERYRYCLGTDQVLYEQRQTWTGATPAVPADTACPGAGWSSVRAAAANVVNGDRAVFAYQGSPTPGTYSELATVAPEDFPTAIALRTTLFVDPETDRAPAESSLTTRVFLRNQNRPPAATLGVSFQGRKVILNASGSADPEGNTLRYQWLRDGAPLTDPATGQPLGELFNAVYAFNAAANTSFTVAVQVFDVGKLSHTSAAVTVTCNSNTCTPS